MRASTAPRTLLLSVHPRFARAILDGRKTVELRRQRVGATDGAVVILYATSPVMAVLGTTRLDSVESASPHEIWQRHGPNTSLTRQECLEYLDGCEIASALTLSDATALSAPVLLRALRATSPFQPPQSYRYVGLGDPLPLRELSPELLTLAASSSASSHAPGVRRGAR